MIWFQHVMGKRQEFLALFGIQRWFASRCEGSRVAVWPAAGAWVAACRRPGAAAVAVLAFGERPSVADALVLAPLADAAAGSRPPNG